MYIDGEERIPFLVVPQNYRRPTGKGCGWPPDGVVGECS